MTPPGETVAASSADHVTFSTNDIAGMKIGDVRSGFDDFTDKLVANRHGHRNGALRPIVPFINMDVSPANSRAAHANQHIVHSGPRGLDVFQPQPRLALALDEGFHETPLSDIVTLMLKATFFLLSCAAYGQLSEKATWATEAQNRYVIKPNIIYGMQNNFETKLDVYQRRDLTGPQPTIIYIHGGGWTGGSKETSVMSLFPYFEMGWNVVNVEYRLEKISPAPAAVEDCLCALRWIGVHAHDYNIDPARMVVTGESAGGHLALTTGMIPMSAGLDRQCPGPDLPKVAAILDWYGITDVNDLLDGPNQKGYAVQWLGSMPNKEQIAKRVSPLEYVRPGLPPILMIQGDADPTVPYSHSVRLHEALDKADVPNQLLTIPGGKHGNFTPEERVRIHKTTREFLSKYHLM